MDIIFLLTAPWLQALSLPPGIKVTRLMQTETLSGILLLQTVLTS